MRIVTWNVNGLRAVWKKGFAAWLGDLDADVVCLQEVKARPDQLEPEMLAPAGWHASFFPAERAGYSGVATYSRKKPRANAVQSGFGAPRFDAEGRVLVTRHAGGLSVYNVYFPNGKKDDERLAYKLDFYDELLAHVNARVAEGEKVVVCGDWNTAHREIDLARPKENRKTSGFMPEECAKVDDWVESGWVDAYRALHPDRAGAYSWWSLRSGARERNVGWRLDYHMVSGNLADRVRDAAIHVEVPGSDHCPVSLELKS
ncbi:MAG: exodeoxyribonuclease III [Planctomycetota bacterium]